MVSTAALGALALQDYTEAAGVSFLFAISSSLETLANARTRNALSSLVNSSYAKSVNVINPITKERVVLPAGEN